MHRDAVRTLFETRCLENADGVDLRTGLAAITSTVGELFDPTFRTSIANCAFLGDCDANAMEWQSRYMRDRPALDPMGPPVFIHLGETDVRVTPSSMACPIQEMVDAGVSVSTCVYDATNHNALAGAAAPFTVDLATALAAGTAPPTCRDATAAPTCP